MMTLASLTKPKQLNNSKQNNTCLQEYIYLTSKIG